MKTEQTAAEPAEDYHELIVNPDDGEEPQPEQTASETETETETEPDAETKAEQPDYEKQFSELASQLEQLKKENNRLGYKLRENEKKAVEPKESVFTEAQLKQLMKEHADDPEVVYEIVKQMQYQAGKSIEKSAEEKAILQNKRKELVDITNNILPGAIDEGSQIYSEIEQTRDYLGLRDSPFGDVLALSLMSLKNLPNLIENIKEQTKKELLSKTSDAKRKESIKETAPTDTSKQTKRVITPSIDETAKRLGLNDRQMKRYQEILSKSRGGTIQASI